MTFETLEEWPERRHKPFHLRMAVDGGAVPHVAEDADGDRPGRTFPDFAQAAAWAERQGGEWCVWPAPA